MEILNGLGKPSQFFQILLGLTEVALLLLDMGHNLFVASSCAGGNVTAIILAWWLTLEEVTLVSMPCLEENNTQGLQLAQEGRSRLEIHCPRATVETSLECDFSKH